MLEKKSVHHTKTGDEWSPDLELEDLGSNPAPVTYYVTLRTLFDITGLHRPPPKMIIKYFLWK